ncbi:MAG: SAM-dependent methyltransferase [Propionibacteriaceae bacterium]
MDPPDFDALYGGDPDPWQVNTSFYEQRKLGVVLASLTAARYSLAWDPACGTGELVTRLALRCDRVLATDASVEAVQIARRRCGGWSNVEVTRGVLPSPPPPAEAEADAEVDAQTEVGAGVPADGPDLVVLAEFLYYLDQTARQQTLEMITACAAPAAEVMSLHWRHRAADAWLSGADMQSEISTTLTGLGWQRTVHHEEPDFVLDAFRR